MSIKEVPSTYQLAVVATMWVQFYVCDDCKCLFSTAFEKHLRLRGEKMKCQTCSVNYGEALSELIFIACHRCRKDIDTTKESFKYRDAMPFHLGCTNGGVINELKNEFLVNLCISFIMKVDVYPQFKAWLNSNFVTEKERLYVLGCNDINNRFDKTPLYSHVREVLMTCPLINILKIN